MFIVIFHRENFCMKFYVVRSYNGKAKTFSANRGAGETLSNAFSPLWRAWAELNRTVG